MALEGEEVLGGGRSSVYLQCLHMLIDPGGFFLQAGDGVFGANQSTIDPTLGKNERELSGSKTPTPRTSLELRGGSVYTLILPWSGHVTLSQDHATLDLRYSCSESQGWTWFLPHGGKNSK